jgi:curved DNA-binding protein CbpA
VKGTALNDYAQLQALANRIAAAQRPEDLFGDLSGDPDAILKQARRAYYQLAQQIHPDKISDVDMQRMAHSASARLNALWDRAEAKIQRGTYGSKRADVQVTTPNGQVIIGERIATGDICVVYACDYRDQHGDYRGVFKVARQPADNDLVSNEAAILKYLRNVPDSDDFHPYYPQVLESLRYKDASASGVRQAHVLRYFHEVKQPTDLYSLAEVREHYKQGIHPADMAWMWRRVLVALGFVHQQQVIHGAVLPTHILIHPGLHGVVLIDWSYAVNQRQEPKARISAISNAYEKWYPQEVFDKQTPTAALDIFMAARCMVDLVGGDPLTGDMPAAVPDKMQRYFKWCLQPGARMRPQRAYPLLEEFDELLAAIWGPRTYREFTMPERR